MINPCPQCGNQAINIFPEIRFYHWHSIKPHVVVCMCGHKVRGENRQIALAKWNSQKVKPGMIFDRLKPGEEIVGEQNRRSSPTELVIIRGLPGSGKSTKAKTDYPDHLHYEPDHLFCDTQGRYRFDEQFFPEAKTFVRYLADFALSRGESVVVSDVLPRVAEVEEYRELAEAHGAAFKVVECSEQFGNCHQVPLMVIEKMRAQYEPWNGGKVPEFLKRQAD